MNQINNLPEVNPTYYHDFGSRNKVMFDANSFGMPCGNRVQQIELEPFADLSSTITLYESPQPMPKTPTHTTLDELLAFLREVSTSGNGELVEELIDAHSNLVPGSARALRFQQAYENPRSHPISMPSEDLSGSRGVLDDFDLTRLIWGQQDQAQDLPANMSGFEAYSLHLQQQQQQQQHQHQHQHHQEHHHQHQHQHHQSRQQRQEHQQQSRHHQRRRRRCNQEMEALTKRKSSPSNLQFDRIYTPEEPPTRSRRQNRVEQACQQCHISKRKCSVTWPCVRCVEDGIECTPPSPKFRGRKKDAAGPRRS